MINVKNDAPKLIYTTVSGQANLIVQSAAGAYPTYLQIFAADAQPTEIPTSQPSDGTLPAGALTDCVKLMPGGFINFNFTGIPVGSKIYAQVNSAGVTGSYQAVDLSILDGAISFNGGSDSPILTSITEYVPTETYTSGALVYYQTSTNPDVYAFYQNTTGNNAGQANPANDTTNWSRIVQTTELIYNSTAQTQNNFNVATDLSTTLIQTTTAVGANQDNYNTQTTNSINNLYAKSVAILGESATLQGKTTNLSSTGTLPSVDLIDSGGYTLYGVGQNTVIPANSTQNTINTAMATTTQGLATAIQTNTTNINTNSQEIAALASQLSAAAFEAVTSASVTVTGTSSTVFTALPLKAANTQSQAAIVGGNIKISSNAATAQSVSVGGNLNITKSNTNSLFNGYIYNVTAGVRVGNAVTGISGTLYNLPLRATITVVASTTALTNGGYNVHAGDVLQFRLYRTGNATGTVIVTQGSSTYVYATSSGGYTNVTSNSVQMVGVTGVTSSQTLTSFVNNGVALSRLVTTLEQPTAYKSNRVYHEFCQTDVFNLKTYCPAIASANFSNGYLVETITDSVSVNQVFNVKINGVNTRITRNATLTSATWTGSLTYSDYLPSFSAAPINLSQMQRFVKIGGSYYTYNKTLTPNLNVYRAVLNFMSVATNGTNTIIITGLTASCGLLNAIGTIFCAGDSGVMNTLLSCSGMLVSSDGNASLIYMDSSLNVRFAINSGSSVVGNYLNQPVSVMIEIAAP